MRERDAGADRCRCDRSKAELMKPTLMQMLINDCDANNGHDEKKVAAGDDEDGC